LAKPRIVIIFPAWETGWRAGGKILASPLVLALLAALTPPEFEILLIDENVEPVDTNILADLVAISCMTASSPRAYEIADAFRARGIPVVLGGIHPTIMPDEAGQHADTVVVGEAEPVWKTLLEDFAAGHLKPRYQHDVFCDLVNLPVPRRELLHQDRYFTTNIVQTARGCPNACSFCSVWKVAGRKYRFRPIPEVIAELRTLRGKRVGFIDDNFPGNPFRAKELLEAMIPLKLKWVGQATLDMAKDPELLRLLALSGCYAMFVGIESVSQENLSATHKVPNIGLDMEVAIRTIHRAGIEIVGSFVLGLDEDGPSVFADTLEFAERNKLALAQFSALTPFPGTLTRQQLVDEGRILSNDWGLYTMGNVVYQPKHMTPEELAEGRARVLREFYSIPSIIRRNATTRRRLGPRLVANLLYRYRGTF